MIDASCVWSLEGNGTRASHKGCGFSGGGIMYTLNTTEVHCVAYRIGSYESNAWKSGNPQSGVYETEQSNTLDSHGSDPSRRQGGIVIVEGHIEDMGCAGESSL